MDLNDFFTRRLQKMYDFIGVSGYPSSNLSVAALTEFKASVDAAWAIQLKETEQARNTWAREYLELERMTAKAPEAKVARVDELRRAFKAASANLLNARRAEELTRALPLIYSGDTSRLSWFEYHISVLESYTPGLPV